VSRSLLADTPRRPAGRRRLVRTREAFSGLGRWRGPLVLDDSSFASLYNYPDSERIFSSPRRGKRDGSTGIRKEKGLEK